MPNEVSVAAVFQNHVRKYGERVCVTYKQEGRYTDISWNRMDEMVRVLASFLIRMGIGKGDRIAIFSPNRYEWWVTDMAVLSIRAVDVPIYDTDSAEEAFGVLDHSGARACFVGGKEHLNKVVQSKGNLPNLQFIVSYDPVSPASENVFAFTDALEKGRPQDTEEELMSRLRYIRPSDLATIIYTSGTTGQPKGVMLSHHNLISNVSQIMAIHGILTENDLFLSFLPLSHVLERTAGYYLPISVGARVAFAESFSKLQQNLTEIRPTVIIGVPRFYEKIHAGILSRLTKASSVRKTIFHWAMEVASENVPYLCRNMKRKGWFAIKYRLADRLIFSKIKAALGLDRLRFSVSGGGPLCVSDALFFLGMGLVVLEGYGLTETSPVTNVNRPWLIKPGTVGTPLPDTTVKFSDEGEILIKGPQLMLGYYRDEDLTREAFTEDGFLRTGDIGFADEDGYLSITDRIKDIIITSGGKNIAPHLIEKSLLESRLIEQVSVIGDRRKYLSALIVPAFDELKRWAEDSGIVFRDNEELVRNHQVIGLYEKEIEQYMDQFAQVEKIKKFSLLASEWSQGTGELTSTLKIRRRVVEEKYKHIIDQMYPPDLPAG